ncbi:MAG TPA: enoyl-CoA hydratase-related protein [Thermomicrobiales bacterium]|nr:enoyl-CoA hydratase-related protein [Thermomicrobiales bacterium]
MAEDLLVERRGAVATVVLNRPEVHNAFRYDMWRGLAAAVRDCGADPAVRAIVIRGAGERAFASGADIAEFPERRGTPEQAAIYHAAVADALRAVAEVARPVIAMIHGYCIGGGCELAIACDLRLADTRARFGIPAAKLGVVLGVQELRQLAGLVGLGAAKEILYTGRLLDAGEALRIGLVNRVVPPDELAATVDEVTGQIARNAPLSIAAAKALLGRLERGDSPEELAAAQADFGRRALASEDHREAVRAFLEKRPPRFGVGSRE